MAAPSAGAVLADLGADVIKVEPPRGDPMRTISRQPKLADDSPLRGIDPSFQVDNRGKRSIAVAVDQPAGAELVRRLAADPPGLPDQPAPPPPGALRPRPRRPLRRQPPDRARHADRLRPRGAGGVASRLRRDRLLRTGRGDRLVARAGRRCRPSPPRPGRPHDRPRPGGGDPRRPAPGRTDRRRPGRRHVAARDGGVDHGHRPVGHAPRPPAGAEAGPAPPDQPARQPLPLRGRPLDHPQHARGPLVGQGLRRPRTPRVGQRRALQHPQGPLRQHAGGDRPARRGVRHPHRRRVGAAVRRRRPHLGSRAGHPRAGRRPPGPGRGRVPAHPRLRRASQLRDRRRPGEHQRRRRRHPAAPRRRWASTPGRCWSRPGSSEGEIDALTAEGVLAG